MDLRDPFGGELSSKSSFFVSFFAFPEFEVNAKITSSPISLYSSPF